MIIELLLFNSISGYGIDNSILEDFIRNKGKTRIKIRISIFYSRFTKFLGTDTGYLILPPSRHH